MEMGIRVILQLSYFSVSPLNHIDFYGLVTLSQF